MLAINNLLALQDRWDFMHVDVQGEEVKICEAGLGLTNERVRWLVVGTRSRVIEGLRATKSDADFVQASPIQNG